MGHDTSPTLRDSRSHRSSPGCRGRRHSQLRAGGVPLLQRSGLRSGQTNTCAQYLQTYLNGYINADLVCDGAFGPTTKSVVQTFQSRVGLSAHGVVGRRTKDRICSRIGIPVNSGATDAEIRAAADAVVPTCRGWGYCYD